MLVGDGSISVEPAALEAMAARASSVAGGTSATRGSFGGAASAAAGCEEPAAGSFSELQSLLSGALSCLEDCSSALGTAVSNGATAYVGTDANVCPAP
jgi:uncharacterized protein YukE